ncbi:MAG: hypothetical protein CMM15_11090 [Rhodospirillaceae bacterium]|nr:hypothetical protein [Rhodospirillaceae bacterium]OUX67899.1 MAG: hypothetical protein CBD38_01345 [bacterium TMED178]
MQKVFWFSFVLSLILFIILDSIWFQSFSLKYIYRPQFQQINQGPFLRKKLWTGIFTWIVLAFTAALYITSFYEEFTLARAFVVGLYLGFAIYFVYNFTNYATINKYSIRTATIDTMWGSILFGTVCCITTIFAKVI